MQDNNTFKENFKRRIYEFILRIISFIEKLPKNDDVCRIVRDQLIRSVTSIGANYIEAIAASSRKDFTNFLSHCLKSANETKFWLALLRDTHKTKDNVIGVYLSELKEIANILGSSVKTLRMEKINNF